MLTPDATSGPHPTSRPHVRVALVGSRTDVADIAPMLPRRWHATRHHRLSTMDGADIVVLGAATSDRVAAARLLNPTATIVAVIDPQAPVAFLVQMMRAGADACVRSGTSALLAEEVLAAHQLRHRQSRLAGRDGWRPAA